MRTKRIFLGLSLLMSALLSTAQEKWDLRRCVDYAWANNISVKQSDINARMAAINAQQAKWQQYPSVNFNGNLLGYQSGRSIDPTTNLYTTTQLLGQSFSLNAGIELFNWNRIRNNIISARYEEDASHQDLEKVKNDIGLSVASFYLQVLLSREQMNISKVQMEQTFSQLEATRKRVSAGDLPELNALQLESQYATDSSNYITAKASADQNLLQLKALLNLDAAQDFDISTPPVDVIPVDPIAQMQPEVVYALAVANQPAQKANELRLKSLAASIKSAKAAKYPSFSLGGGLGTNFANTNQKLTGFTFVGYQQASQYGPVADNNGTYYPILQPDIQYSSTKKSFGEMWKGWGDQINQNFRQNVGISVAVPILNGGQAKFAVERAKLNYRNGELIKEQANQTLKNDIYTAYYNAVAALEKFNAARLAVESNEKTYQFSKKRYDLDLLSTFDLITSQNNLTRARLDMTLSHFDYVFKMKVLEFYKGMGLRLQ